MLEIGTVVERFRIVRPVGIQGAITQYKAESPEGAAIRLMVFATCREPTAEEVLGFEHSMRGWGKPLDSYCQERSELVMFPAVLATGFSAEAGGLWTASPWTIGESLQLRFQGSEDGVLALGEFRAFCPALSRALTTAHKRGFVHGLLRPSCIQIHKTTQTYQVRILELGLGHFWSTGGRTLLVENPEFEQYLAPELSKGELGAGTDIFSLGRLITVSLPNKKEMPGWIIRRILRWIDCAAAPKVEDRFPDMVHATKALEQTLPNAAELELRKEPRASWWKTFKTRVEGQLKSLRPASVPIKPKRFEVSFGPHPSNSVSWDGASLHYRYTPGERYEAFEKKESLQPSTKTWRQFWRALETHNIWQWGTQRFEPPSGARDGLHWKVTIEYQEKKLDCSGQIIRPKHGYGELLRALQELLSGREIG